MMDALVEFKHVSKAFGEKKVLADLSFAVARGEILAVVGASGTGKSVTLKHIAGLIEPDAGEVVTNTSRIGYLFQSGALLAWMTVAENVALPLRETTSLSEDEIDRRVAAALDAVGLADSADLYPAEISGGMQKRAGLARAIVRETDLILYDEPTSGLDPVTSSRILALIGEIHASRRVTSVLVTHDILPVLKVATRILMLDGGKAIICASPAEFLESTHPRVVEFIAAAKGEGQ